MVRPQAATLPATPLPDPVEAGRRAFSRHATALRLAWAGSLPTLLAATVTIVLFGLTPVTTRIAIVQIDGGAVGLFRTVGAGILAVPVLLLFRLRPPRGWRDWGLLALAAAGGFVAFPLLFSLGAERTSACHAGLIAAAMPLFTGLIGMAAKRRLPPLGWLVGAAIALAGEAVLVAPGARPAAVPACGCLVGDALVFGACVAVSASFVAGVRLTEKIGAWAAIFWSIALAGIALAPMAAAAAGRVEWSQLTPQSWAALIHLTFGAGLIAWVCWFWALARGGIARIAVLQFLQPVLTLILASLLLSEALTAPVLAAGGAILFGVVVARRSQAA